MKMPRKLLLRKHPASGLDEGVEAVAALWLGGGHRTESHRIGAVPCSGNAANSSRHVQNGWPSITRVRRNGPGLSARIAGTIATQYSSTAVKASDCWHQNYIRSTCRHDSNARLSEPPGDRVVRRMATTAGGKTGEPWKNWRLAPSLLGGRTTLLPRT